MESGLASCSASSDMQEDRKTYHFFNGKTYRLNGLKKTDANSSLEKKALEVPDLRPNVLSGLMCT